MARDLATDYERMTKPDAIHIATALHSKADVLYTFDGAKDNKAKRSGGLIQYDGAIGSPPLRIEEPKMDFGALWNLLEQNNPST